MVEAESLCKGRFCALVQTFQVPARGIIRDQFFEYLLKNGAENPGIPINTKGMIFQNTQCPFCRLVAHLIQKSQHANAPDASECYVILQFGSSFWVEIRKPDEKHPSLLMNFSERIVLVSAFDQASAEDGRLYDTNRVNLATVHNWLQLCDELHQDICPASQEARLARTNIPATLRVIDVINNCLIDIPWTDTYVALSYVWGDAEPPKLFEDELPKLYKINSLRSLQGKMPNTIRDSMTFTAGLGLQYLWFDSLCLVQDNKADLEKGILNMDIIYEGAYFTIIAANGPGANSGLPGIGQTSRGVKQQRYVLKEGLELMDVLSLDNHLNGSVWASRGWTLQEHYLSRRTINFVNGQAYFRCRQRIWCEELWTDLDPKLQDSGEWVMNLVALARESMDLEETVAAPHNYLFRAVDRFQQRNLTHEDDAIKAMTGILQRVALKGQTQMLEGLPVDIFPLSMNFLSVAKEGSKRRKGFPSWSWAGWTSELEWHAFMQLDLDEHPEELGQALGLTCAFIKKYDPEKDSRAGEVLWSPDRSMFTDSTPFLFEPHQAQYEFTSLLPGSRSSKHRYDSLLLIAVTIHIQLKAVVSNHTETEIGDNSLWQVVGKNNYFCGYVLLDEVIEEIHNRSLEMLLLSQCISGKAPFPGSWDQGSDDEPRFWAMLVISVAGHVYERRGMGQILRHCIPHSYQPGPRWQKLVLE